MGMTIEPGLEPAVDAREGAEGTRLDLDGVCRWFGVGGTVVKALDDVNLHVDESRVCGGPWRVRVWQDNAC